MSKELSEINMGMVGHVDHGKTTLTEALTGKFTDEHSEELKRGISIRLGYADFSINKCSKCKSNAYTTFDKCLKCKGKTKHLRTLSVVDVPGHETLMATVLTGASLMDGAILVIAANEKCPQPQTAEHLETLNIAEIKNIIIVQNKIDLVSEVEAEKNYKEIKSFVKGSVAEKAPIIPISAQHRVNITYLLEAIEKNIPTPKRDLKKDPKMFVARSFDVNKPGISPSKLIGGVIGGSVIEGRFKLGDEIEIGPGIKVKDKWGIIKTKIKSINESGISLKEGKPGGLIAFGTTLDPYLSKSDNLVGNIVSLPEKLPEIWDDVSLEISLLKRIVGTEKGKLVENIKVNDSLLMNVGTGKTIGLCTDAGKTSKFQLKIPICASVGDKVALSKQIDGRWRLIGLGKIV